MQKKEYRHIVSDRLGTETSWAEFLTILQYLSAVSGLKIAVSQFLTAPNPNPLC